MTRRGRARRMKRAVMQRMKTSTLKTKMSCMTPSLQHMTFQMR